MVGKLLEARNISCLKPDGSPILHDISLDVFQREVVVLRGRSGTGKSTLLKCLAHLNLYSGDLTFKGKSPVEYGVPRYRTLVSYVPQRTSLLPGTPREFLQTVHSYSSRRAMERDKPIHEGPIEIAHSWDLPEEVWDRPWSSLSGGEAQRVSLAIAIGIGIAEILLLDEPTSALDNETTDLVEKRLLRQVQAGDTALQAIVWITHSPEQAARVATRSITVGQDGSFVEVNTTSDLV